jgi:hypothetical protein
MRNAGVSQQERTGPGMNKQGRGREGRTKGEADQTYLVAIVLNLRVRVVQVAIHAHHLVEHGPLCVHP